MTLSKPDQLAYEAFNAWKQRESKRVDFEWSQWDGSEAHGVAINDKQCARIDIAKAEIGIDDAMMTRFRDVERANWQEKQRKAVA